MFSVFSSFFFFPFRLSTFLNLKLPQKIQVTYTLMFSEKIKIEEQSSRPVTCLSRLPLHKRSQKYAYLMRPLRCFFHRCTCCHLEPGWTPTKFLVLTFTVFGVVRAMHLFFAKPTSLTKNCTSPKDPQEQAQQTLQDQELQRPQDNRPSLQADQGYGYTRGWASGKKVEEVEEVGYVRGKGSGEKKDLGLA